MSNKNKHNTPVNGTAMKGFNSVMPSVPVIAPMINEPTSKTMDPLARMSRYSSDLLSFAELAVHEANQRADIIAGTSITAAIATM